MHFSLILHFSPQGGWIVCLSSVPSRLLVLNTLWYFPLMLGPVKYLNTPNKISSYSKQNMEIRCSKCRVADGQGLTFVGANGRLTDISPQAHSCLHLPPHTQMQSENTKVHTFKTPHYMTLMRRTIWILRFWLRAVNRNFLNWGQSTLRLSQFHSKSKKPQKAVLSQYKAFWGPFCARG